MGLETVPKFLEPFMRSLVEEVVRADLEAKKVKDPHGLLGQVDETQTERRTEEGQREFAALFSLMDLYYQTVFHLLEDGFASLAPEDKERIEPDLEKLSYLVEFFAVQEETFGEDPMSCCSVAEALRLSETTLTWIYQQGSGYLEGKEFAKAALLFSYLVMLEPAVFKAWCALGVCHFEQGEFEEAKRSLEFAQDLDGTSQLAKILYTETLLALDQIPEAKRALEDVEKSLQRRQEKEVYARRLGEVRALLQAKGG